MREKTNVWKITEATSVSLAYLLTFHFYLKVFLTHFHEVRRLMTVSDWSLFRSCSSCKFRLASSSCTFFLQVFLGVPGGHSNPNSNDGHSSPGYISDNDICCIIYRKRQWYLLHHIPQTTIIFVVSYTVNDNGICCIIYRKWQCYLLHHIPWTSMLFDGCIIYCKRQCLLLHPLP